MSSNIGSNREEGMNLEYVIQTNQLTKVLGGKEIVSGVSIKVKKGEIYSILGPNGAGKTSLMKMLLNLVKPTSGEIELVGQRLTAQEYDVFAKVGSMIEYPIFYEKMSALENLELHCAYMGYHDKQAIKEALQLVGLQNIEDKIVKDFSLGMKQRLGIARAIVTKPHVLILDEPINGLDPVGIKEMRELFHKLSKEYGITLFIASHILGEIEQIADTVGVLNRGKLIKEVPMQAIKDHHTEYYELITKTIKKACFVLEHVLGIQNFKVIGEQTMRIYDTRHSQSEMNKQLILQDVDVESLNRQGGSLEEYFLELIGENKPVEEKKAIFTL